MLKYLNLSNDCIRMYDFDCAKLYADSASIYTDKIKNYELLGFYYQILGDYNLKRDDIEAHKNYYKAIECYEKSGQDKQLIPIYCNLAFSYIQKCDVKMLKEIINKMHAINSKRKDVLDIVDTYEITAFYYNCLYAKNPQSTFLDSLIFYETKVVSMFEASPEIQHKKKDISYNYILLADNLTKKQNYNPDSVTYFLKKAKQWSNPCDTSMIVNCNWIEGNIAYNTGNFKKAETIFDQQLSLMDDWANKGNLSMYVDVCDRLSEIAEIKKDYFTALYYERKKNNSLNTIHDIEKDKAIKELEVKYETEKKEKLIQQLKEINLFREKINWLYSGFCLLGLFSFFFIIRWIKSSKKAANSQLQLIQMEKKEIELQAKLKDEQFKKIKLEKYSALLDSHFKDLKISEMDNTLINLKKEQKRLNKQIQDYSERLLEYEQSKQLRFDSTIEGSYFYNITNDIYTSIINRIKPFNKQKIYIDALNLIKDDFFLNLKQAYPGNLSAINTEYCVCFAIGMDNEDIANCFNVEQRSIHTVRYRLRNKFKIDKEFDFDIFLKQLMN